MNFFGHAVVASELSSDRYVVLGAMLPDLEAMVDSTASRFTDPQVGRGITLHHVTDSVFHAASDFLAHQKAARVMLEPLPVRKGPRRAVAHVGVELILDAALRTPSRVGVYVQALAAGADAAPLEGISLLKRIKLRSLFGTLARRAPFVTPHTPSGVVERLERALWSRPGLRLERTELVHVQTWAERAWQPIHDASQPWLAQLVHAVDAKLGFDAASAPPPPK